MTCDELVNLAEEIKQAVEFLAEDDQIKGCGHAPLHIIKQRPDDVLTLAHEKLHTWKFDQVETCWRRLYEEASIWKVVRLLCFASKSVPASTLKRKRSPSPRVEHDATISPVPGHGDWITNVVHVLDMALILTGAPRRRHLIHHILDALNTFVVPDKTQYEIEQSFPTADEIEQSFPTAPLSSIPEDTISRKEKLDFLAFQHHIETHRVPLIMTGVISDWPAMADPNHMWIYPSYLLKSTLDGRRLVPVELGRSYTDQGWSQKIMTFAEYMTTYLLQPKQKQTGYLAQHDLFDQIPSLAADTRTPDYCYTSPPPPDPAYASTVPVDTLDEPLRNAWLGPAGTISPMHTDPYHNILCQLVGCKYIRLYPPSETSKLYPRGIDETGVNMENTSHVDISEARQLFSAAVSEKDGFELRRTAFQQQYPLFKDAQYIEAILRPGECLYIPVGWWHYIESLSTSFSMSFWWN